MATKEEEKSALSPRQCTMSQVNCNDSKTTWIALRIASAPTLFSRSVPQWLLAVFRPQKNAPGKEIWLQWRSEFGNRDVFWGQRQIVLKKGIESLEKRWNQCIIVEGDLMNKVELCLKVVVSLVRPGTYWVIYYTGCIPCKMVRRPLK